MAELWQPGDTVDTPDGKVMVFTGADWVDQLSPAAARFQAQANPLPPGRLARTGRGLMDVGMGAAQLAGALTPEQQAAEAADIALYERGAGSGFDPFRVAGQAAATAPLMLAPGMAAAGLVGRTAAGAAAGAGAGASLFASEPGERVTNVLTGLAGGGLGAAVLPPVARAAAKVAFGAVRGAGRLWRGLRPGVRATVTANLRSAAERAGMSLDELSEGAIKGLQEQAAKAFRAGNLDADALIRKTQADEFGFTGPAAPTRGQVTRDPTQFSDEVNLSKLDAAGGPLRERFGAQRARVGEVLDNTRTRIGAAVDETPDAAGEAVEAAVQRRAADWQAKVRSAYQEAEEMGREAAGFPRVALRQRTAQILRDHRDDISSGVKSRIQELTDTSEGKRQLFSFKELEQLDKLITETSDIAKGPQRIASGKLKASLQEVMDDAIDLVPDDLKGAYRAAKAEATKRFTAIGPRGGMIGKLVEGAFDPAAVAPKLMRGAYRQIDKLKDFIGQTDPEAWGRIQGAVWNEIQGRATPSGNFSQAAYNKAVKSVGKRRLAIIFGDDVADDLLKFGKVAQDLLAFPAGHRVNTSNTASAGANMLRSALGGIADMVPGGRIATPLINMGVGDAGQAAQMRLVAEALSGAPGGAPLTALPPHIEGLLSQGARLAPGLGVATPGLMPGNRR